MMISNIIFIIILINAILSLILKPSGNIFCGIIAFSGNTNFNEDKIKSLFLFNASRGMDACGMYNNGELTKSTQPILSVISNWNFIPEQRFLGHTRKATSAYKEIKHAHPFEFENIIGVHNGMISNQWNISQSYGLNYSQIDTDSEILIHALNSTYDVLKEIEGYASVVFYNKQNPNTIFCFRKNDDRPLWRGKTEEGMYISSMKESLEFIKCTNIEEFKTETLYEIVDGKIINTKKLKKKVEIVKTPTIPYGNEGYTQGYLEGYKGGLVKVTAIDATAYDPNHNIVVGRYYKLSKQMDTNSKYCTFDVNTDKNNIELKAPQQVVYHTSCVENYCITKAGMFALCLTDGASYTKKGDIVYINTIENPLNNSGESKLTYEILHPDTETRDTLKVTWERKHFKLLRTFDVLKMWNDMTDDEKMNLGDSFKKKLGDAYANVKSYYKDLSILRRSPEDPDSEIIRVEDKIRQLTDTNIRKILSIIGKEKNPHNILQSVIDAVSSKDLNALLLESNKINENAKEDTTNYDTDVFMNYYGVDSELLAVTWIELGTIMNNLQKVYDDISNMEKSIITLSQDAIAEFMNNNIGIYDEFENTLFYDSIVELEDQISSCKFELEEISSILIEEYSTYDKKYEIKEIV